MTVVGKEKSPTASSACAVETGPDADAVREIAVQAREQIRQATPAIVAAVILKANDGSYLHARFLFELAAMFPLPAGRRETGPRRDIVTEMLKRIGLYDAADARQRALSASPDSPGHEGESTAG